MPSSSLKENAPSRSKGCSRRKRTCTRASAQHRRITHDHNQGFPQSRDGNEAKRGLARQLSVVFRPLAREAANHGGAEREARNALAELGEQRARVLRALLWHGATAE